MTDWWLGLALAVVGGGLAGWGLWHYARARQVAVAFAVAALTDIRQALIQNPALLDQLTAEVWRSLPPVVQSYLSLPVLRAWAAALIAA